MGRVWPGATRGVDFKGVDMKLEKEKFQNRCVCVVIQAHCALAWRWGNVKEML